MKGTIAIDFDGVIHKYSKGWQDGSIYDEPMEGAFEAIDKLMNDGYTVFILSTRSPWQIQKWLDKHLWMYDAMITKAESINVPEGYWNDKRYFYGFRSEVIWQPWIKFWNKKRVLGITNKKLPAVAYIDDRAVLFTTWKKLLKAIDLGF